MTVANFDAIRGGWCFVLATPGRGTDPSDYGRIVELAERVSDRMGVDFRAWQWVPIDAGWLGAIDASAVPTDAGWADEILGRPTAEASVRAWLAAVADEWGDDATIEPRPRRRRPRTIDMSPTISLGMAYSTTGLDTLPVERLGRTWAVQPDVTLEVAHRAAGWMDLDGATQYYEPTRFVDTWTIPTLGVIPPHSLAEAVSDPLGGTSLRAQRTKPARHREVKFGREGRVSCQDVDPTRSTRDHLAQLLDCMRWSPGALDYAFVAWVQGTRDVWWSDHMHYDLPGGLGELEVRGFRTLWSTYAPDAFGVQVLTDAHLERAHDLSEWVIEELAPGRHLVTARDLDPWLATPAPHHEDEYRLSPPPADVVSAARADFGDMLLSRAQANELWHRTRN